MKRKNLLILMITLLSALSSMMISCKKNSSLEEVSPVTNKMKPLKTESLGHPAGLQTNLRMFGYYSIFGGSWEQQMDSVNIDQLTDVSISFINPNSSGVFTISNDIAQAVVKGHNHDLKMHFSVGGGGGPAYWDDLIKPANRAQVISNIRKVLTTYNFEGVDVDLEGPRITADYNGFMIQLSDTLRQYSKELSCALIADNANLLSATVYSRLDFINVMSYDHTFSTPQAHSSFADFQYSYNVFHGKIAAAKINMGVPGYAWVYNGNTPSTQIGFKNIWQQYPKAYAQNFWKPNSTTSWWYDGHPVLRQKVAFCLQNGVGGMMMWQIMHDPKDNTASLLKLMNYCAGNPATGGFDPTRSYVFGNYGSGMLMEVAGASLSDWAGIQQNNGGGGLHQQWLIATSGTGFKIINKNSGKALDEVDETPSGVGVQFTQSTSIGDGNQTYQLVPNALGYYKIVNVASNRLASVYQNSTVAGTKIVQAADVNAVGQQWRISVQ